MGRVASPRKTPDPRRRFDKSENVIILGLNAFHADSAAAIVRDGKLIAAAEEERFRRVKHWAGFPTQAIEYCLRETKVDLSDVDHVAVNQDSRANILRKLGYVLSHRPDPALVIARWRNRQHRAGVLDLLSESISKQELARHVAQDRASSCAFIVGIPRVAIRGGGHCIGRRFWRFF